MRRQEMMELQLGIWQKSIREYGDAYMTAWFLMTLKGSSEAGKVFMGQDAELLNNPNREDITIKKSDF